MNKLINPKELVSPVGYSHAVETNEGRTIYLSGQVAFSDHGKMLHSGDMAGQFDRALHNLQITMRAARGEMTDIVKLLIFVKDKQLYKANLKEIGAIYRNYFGRYFPAMSLVEVSNLFEDEALIEIEGIAVVND